MKKKNQAILLTVLLILSLLVQAVPSNVLSEELSAGENSSLTEAAVSEEIPQENTLPGGGINTTAEPAPETSVVEEATLNDLPAVEEPASETPANEEQAPDAPAVTEPASPAPGTEEPTAESPVNETTQAEATMAVNVNLNDSDGNPLASFTVPSGELLGTLIQYLLPNPTGISMQLEDGSVFQGWSLQPGGEIVSPEQYTLPVVAELNLFAVYSAPAKSEGEELTEEPSEYLDGPDAFDDTPLEVPIDYNIYPETDFGGAPARMKSRSMMRANNPPLIGIDHPTQPGEVMLFKEAKPVDGMVNTWEVVLRIEAKDVKNTSDVVLVIDSSGSMRGSRMTAAKDAARAFVNRLLPSNTTRIAVVSFATNATINQGLTDNAASLNNAITNLIANGGTFTQAGVKQAEALLQNSDADHKHIVLLSDGEPTYSYRIPDDATRRAGYIWVNDRYETGTGYAANAYDSRREGSGSAMTSYIERYQNHRAFYNHGNSAIAEAGFAGSSGYNVFTIGLQTNAAGSGVLQNMRQGNGTFTEVTDISQLTPVFQAIAGQINDAAKDVIVGDPMSEGFQIPAEYVGSVISEPEIPRPTYANNTISWSPNTLIPIAEGSDIKYAELRYRIEINNDILNANSMNGTYPTNGAATVTYKDSQGTTHTEQFPVPYVDPILLVVEKVLLDSQGNSLTSDNRQFTIEVKGQLGNPAYHQIFRLRAGEKRIMTNLRLEDTYTVTETAVSDGSSPSDYNASIEVYGTEQSSFQIDQTSPDSPVTVTNREKPLGKLTVTKVFDPTVRNAIRKSPSVAARVAPSFGFRLTKADGTTEEFTLTASGAGASKTFENLPYGEYRVEEINPGNFTPSYSDTDATNGSLTDGKVTLTILEKEDTVTVTNRPKDGDDSIDITGKKIWSGGHLADHVAVEMQLKRNGEILAVQPAYTVDPAAGTAAEFTYTWTGLQKYDEKGEPYEYTIDEITTPDHYTKSVSADGLTVTNTYEPAIASRIEASKIWVDGPTPRPTIYFELFRKIAGGTEEKVENADVKALPDGTSSVEWLDLPKEDANANLYTYYVKEKLTADGAPATPANYVLSGEGILTLTNTYKAPTGTVQAKKEWVKGKAPRPDIWFQLYRNVEGGAEEIVPNTPIQKLSDGTTTAKWENIDQTDKTGEPYTFSVKEVDANGADFTPPNYTKTENGLSVTNTYKAPLISPIEAHKKWENGPADKPAVGLRLHRYLEGGAPSADPAIDAVSGATTVRLASGSTSAGWQGFPATDEDGVKYIYYIRELYQDGAYNSGTPPTLLYGAPENYTVSDQNYADGSSAEPWTLTNSYVIPKDGEAKAVKVWENGPEPRPSVWFKLYRQIPGGNEEAVPEAGIRELPDGTTEVTWIGLNETDINGNPYTFIVKEVDAQGNDFTPANYTKTTVDNLKIKNIYESPKADITATKDWQKIPGAPYSPPPVEITLQYSTDGISWQDYAIVGELDGAPEEQVEGSSGEFAAWVYTWTNVPLNAPDGTPYHFQVVEEEVPANFAVSYSGSSDDGFTVTNSWKTISISGTKTWADNNNQDGKRPASLTINIKNGNTVVKTITLDGTTDTNGEVGPWKYEAKDLPKYGENGQLIQYTVEETGYAPYTAGTITPPVMEAGINEYTVDLTNSYTPETVDIKVMKVWNDNGNQDGLRPGQVTVQLYADGSAVNGQTAELKEDNNWTGTFTGLPRYKNGLEITYTVDETGVHAGYTKEITGTSADGFTITNTHTPETLTIAGTKTWNDNNDQDGKRPANLTVNIKNGNTVTRTITLDGTADGNGEAEAWKYEAKDLPKYESGQLINYTVEETGYDPYTAGAITQPVMDAGTNAYTVDLTNSYTPEMITISGTKTWDDNNDQDGKRPASLTVNIKNGNTFVKTITLDGTADQNGEAAPWNYEAKDLPKYEAGQLINYTVEETGYDPYTSGAITQPVMNAVTNAYTVDLTNSYTPEMITISGTKTWDDNNDQDGKRPTSLTVNIKNGDTFVKTITLDGTADQNGEAESWKYEAKDLPKYESGQLINYTVEETGYDPYTSGAITQPVMNAVTNAYTVDLTNSYTPEMITISGTKTWADNNNQDGKRPTSLTINIKNGNTFVKTITLDGTADQNGEAESWKYEAKDLPKYESGQLINYTVEETGYDPYTSGAITQPVMDDDTNAYTVDLTNSYTPATISKTVRKVWDDNNNQDGKRANVTLQLIATANGTQVSWTELKAASASGALMDDDGLVTLTGQINESHTFANLPVKYQGKDIVYTVSEHAPPADYTPGYDQDALTVTNRYTPGVTSRTVSKVWDDNNNQDGKRTDVILKLVATVDSVEVPWADLKVASASSALMDDDGLVTLNKKKNESFTFGNLPVSYQGKDIVYTVEETDVPDGYTEASDQNTLTVTNTHKPATVTITGTKTWDDNDDQDGKRPTEIWINLMKEPGAVDRAEQIDRQRVTPDTAGNWFWSFADKPKYEGGVEIVYSITEDPVDGYSTEVKGYDVTNTHTPEKTSIQVSKVWDDNNNQDGLRPGQVTVWLYADGIPVPDKTVDLKEADNWTGTFSGLPVYKNGQKIKYTVKETGVPAGYTPAVAGTAANSFTITNTHTPETITITGTKTWDDNDDQDGKRPTEIRINLMKQVGTTAAPVPVETKVVTLDPTGNWSWSFTDKPKYEGGVEIVYSIEEEAVDGYSTVVDGYDVTNTHTPDKTSVRVSKVWDDADNLNGVRPESVTIHLLADNVNTGKTLTLSAANNWADAFSGLDVFKAGQKIAYTVTEDSVGNGYEAVIRGNAESGYVVNNKRKVTPNTIVSADPPVEKRVEGRPAVPATFLFEMRAVSYTAPEGESFAMTPVEMPMPAGAANGVKRVRIEGPGSVEFGVCHYSKPGTYVYEITELPGADKNYEYDLTKFKLVDTVVENDHVLSYTRVIQNETTGADVAKAIYVNKYKESGVIIVPPGRTVTDPARPVPTVPKQTAEEYVKLPRTGSGMESTFVQVTLLLAGAAVLIALKFAKRK